VRARGAATDPAGALLLERVRDGEKGSAAGGGPLLESSDEDPIDCCEVVMCCDCEPDCWERLIPALPNILAEREVVW